MTAGSFANASSDVAASPSTTRRSAGATTTTTLSVGGDCGVATGPSIGAGGAGDEEADPTMANMVGAPLR